MSGEKCQGLDTPLATQRIEVCATDGIQNSWKDEEVGFTFVRTANNPTGPAARYAHLWTTDKFPWDNTDERDLSKKVSRQTQLTTSDHLIIKLTTSYSLCVQEDGAILRYGKGGTLARPLYF